MKNHIEQRDSGHENQIECCTVKEAAEILKCSISFIYKLMAEGELGYQRRGRKKLPHVSSIHSYQHRNTVPEKPTGKRYKQPSNYKHLNF